MAAPIELNGPSLPPASGHKAERLVILLHGLGSDGNDLIGLAPHWAPLLPDAEFVAPHAPYRCDMAPMGYQWFPIRGFTPEELLAGAREAAPTLDLFIDRELARTGLRADRVALVGFSQGTMMALYTALRRPHALAGVLGYSGALVGGDLLADELGATPPILMIHGDADPVVPVASLFQATNALGAAGVDAEWHICRGLEHSIDQAGLEIGGDFLRRCLHPPAK